MARKVSFLDGASSGTVPTIGNIVASDLITYADDATFQANEAGSPTEGNIYFNTTLKLVRYYNGTSWNSVVDENSTQTVTNKTVDGLNNTITNVDGDNVIVDTITNLTATDAQAAFAEHQGDIDNHETRITTNEGDIDDLETLSGSPGAANHGTFTGTTIADNTTTKAALQELETKAELNSTNISSNDTDISNLQSDKEDAANKGIANGYCPLDASALVPAANLPSYVDDVLEYANLAAFPGTGEAGKIYIALDTNYQYRWTGTVYVDITSKVDSVNGQSGVVVLDADDIDDTATTNKFATQAQLDKADFITVTQAVNLDTIESDTAANNAKTSAGGSIDSHSDVDTTTVPPVLDDVLKWDGSNFIPQPEGGGGSGQGGINYIINHSGEDDTNDVNVTAQVTKSLITSPIRGAKTLRFVVNNAATTADYFEFVMNDVDPFDKGRKVNISFEYRTFSNYNAGDIKVVLRNVDSGVDIPIYNDTDGDLAVAPNPGSRFQGSAYLDDTDNTYTLRFKVAVSPTLSTTFDIDNVKVGPEEFAPGAIVTEWESFTPTGTWTTNTTYTGMKRRVGDTMEIFYTIATTGIPTTATLLLDMPSGFTVDESKFPSGIAASNPVVGHGFCNNVGVTNYEGTVRYQAGTDNKFGFLWDNGAATSNVSESSPFAFNTGDFVQFVVSVPISGWKASNLISTHEKLMSTVNVLADGNGGTALTANVTNIDFTEVTDPFGVWDGDTFTAAKTMKYSFRGHTEYTAAYNSVLFAYVNGASSKLVGFGTGQTRAAFDLEIELNQGDTLSLRSNGAATLSNVAGRHWLSISSVEDKSVYGVYGETELIESKSSTNTAWPITANQWGDLTSISLTPGEWDISAMLVIDEITGAMASGIRIDLMIGTVAGNNSTGALPADNFTRLISDGTASQQYSTSIVNYNQTITATTTYYLKGFASSSTNVGQTYKISARRIK